MRIQLNGALAYYGTGSVQPSVDMPTILFIHGAGFDHSVWVMPARYFARHGYRVIVPDLPGHGRSEGPALASIDAMADWLAGLLQQVGGGETTIVGHSMGALVALAMGTKHHKLCHRLAVLGAALPMPVGAVLLDAAADNHHAAIDMANTWSHSTQGRLGAAQTPGLSNYISGQRWLERMSDGVFHTDLMACNNFTAGLNVGDIQTLVIVGEKDKMTPLKAGLSVAHSLTQSQTVILPGCGHCMMSEQPNQVLDALADFILP